ncbi:glucose-6-phosphate isomerase [Enhydrobacter aerosaccus]|uniref:Glucose-6-phosphate isomerase n=1 Tax=Enhydrobacter aerosaccus TaxID=225324 RepID=A0A1T4SUH4_9HYPH|nr:glucose-6-phosphate isomerase [Enhydrobacter aerosaccus]SKA31812.1 glucose-6-phosphate isomerase [Enhydrobacter aerosaccus]
MFYSHHIDDALEAKVGPHGLPQAVFDRELARATPALDKIRQWRNDGTLPLLKLPAARDDIAAIRPHAEHFRKFEHLVVFGIGGSNLGGQTLVALKDHGFGPAKGHPKIWFMDNVDPATFAEMCERLPLERTGVFAISKSGTTAETLTQLYSLLPLLEAKVGKANLAKHLLVITEPKDNVLRRTAMRLGCPVLDHDPNIGGRYSVLSLVGLLPALIAGVDVAAVREGAASVLDPVLAAKEATGLAPAVGAALSVGLAKERGVHTTVLMPYCDRLGYFGFWFRQLWAESLGKDGKGTTPVRAMGTVDQHSQLQLYLGGPADKLFTVLILDTKGQGRPIPAAELGGDKSLAYLEGQGLGDLILAEADATAATLVKNGRPTRVIRLKTLDEKVMGALMMHYMLETMFAAELWGVDAFDQPAVEEGKILTRQYLSQRRRS